ncbi:MAG: DUF2804 domain-containing protein [Myxococcales bacterium]|nr:MAG: DUF2804 domain-containing protein [Myxococcales bacterium]
MNPGLFDATGKPAFGAYGGEIADLNLQAWKPAWPWALRRLRAKRWRFVGLYAPSVIVGAAVVDSGYVGTAFVYAWDRESKRLAEFKAMSPLARAMRISDHATHGEARVVIGDAEVSIHYTEQGDRLEVDVPVAGGRLMIEASFDSSRSAGEPHQIVSPTPGGRFAFTHKIAALPAEATVRAPFGERRLTRGQCFAAIDHTAGFHDYRWEWRWTSLGGLSRNGQRVGLNLVAPTPHPTITENALWVDGRRYPVSQANFDFDRAAILSPWHISTADGAVDLVFTPEGERAETIEAGLVMSRFHQPFGAFSGRLKPPDGPALELVAVPGVCEDHAARW